MAMTIVYIACEPTVVNVFLPVAEAFRKNDVNAENIMINPAELLYEHVSDGSSPTELFSIRGFYTEDIKRHDYKDLLPLDHESKAYLFYLRLYRRLDPSIVVVPHEFGYAFYAVQAAKLMGIATYHIQHGIWGPYRFSPVTDTSPYSVNIKKNNRIGNFLYSATGAIRSFFSRCHTMESKEKPHDLALLDEFKGRLIGPPPAPSYVIHSDRMAVWGPYYHNLLLEAHPELKGRLDVVGYIPGDNFLNNAVESRETIYARYGLDENSRLAVYLYTPFQDFLDINTLKHHPTDVLVATIRQLKEIDRDINVLVLSHPNYRFSHYKALLSDVIKTNRFTKVIIDRIHNDHLSLCKAASLIISVKSTILYEAMLVNTVGVLQAYVLTDIDDPQHIEGGAVVPVFCPKHLHKQLKMALTDNGVQKRIRENQKMVCDELLGQFDGRCGERVAMAIANHIKKERT